MAWTVAQLFPQRVERLVAMNCPPPQVLIHDLLTNPSPDGEILVHVLLPDAAAAGEVRGREHPAKMLVAGSYNRTVWNHETLAPYVEAISTPADAAAGELVPRRHAGRRSSRKAGPITAPTLIVWGTKDRFLSLSMIAPQALQANDGVR